MASRVIYIQHPATGTNFRTLDTFESDTKYNGSQGCIDHPMQPNYQPHKPDDWVKPKTPHQANGYQPVTFLICPRPYQKPSGKKPSKLPGSSFPPGYKHNKKGYGHK